jgi:protoporphyrinogen IX oxidase
MPASEKNGMTYDIIKSLHIISVISWMAGMLYLPRLFVYHADAKAGSELSETLKTMERKLLRYIMTPAMIATWCLGLYLMIESNAMQNGWMHAKLSLVIILSGVHGLLAKHRKEFEQDRNRKQAHYYRLLNEVPTLAMIAIVFLVELKPF